MGDLAGYTYGIVHEKVSDEDRVSTRYGADLLQAARTYLRHPSVIGHLSPNDTRRAATRKSQRRSRATISPSASQRTDRRTRVDRERSPADDRSQHAFS